MRWFLMTGVVVASLLVASRSEALRILPQLEVSATDGSSQLIFPLGSPSADAGTSTFLVRNVGAAAATIKSIELFANDAGVFALGPVPTGEFAPGQTATISVQFSPSAVGNFSARVVVDSSAGVDSTLALCGTALETPRSGLSFGCDPPPGPTTPPPVPMAAGCSTSSVGPSLLIIGLLFLRRRSTGVRQ